MNGFKKIVSTILIVLMLVTSAPLQGFVDLDVDLPDWFSGKAEALNVNYCSTAAAQWAINHVYDYNSVLYNKGYWDDGGDCANFVSQCLYMGGMDMNDYWNISGYFCHWSEPYGNTYAGSYVRCQQLYNYLVKQGAQVIQNPKASDVSVGDVILYSREGANRMTHTAIVIDIKNGEPVVAAHSTGTVRYRSDDPYRDWHLNFKPERTYLMKLNGSTCVNQNHKSFDVYVATGSNTRLYKSASTSSGYYNTFITGSNPDYAHVYKKEGNWGYTFRYGKWGWINLSNFTYLSHQESPAVDHVFGDWQVVTVANCKNDGLDKCVCVRCGYEKTRTTKGGHIIDPEATCLSGGFCKVCKAQVQNPLGHDWNAGSITTQPTCIKEGVRTYVCKRDSSHTYTESVAALGHNYQISVTSPSCTSHGESIYTCTRCKDSYIGDFNEENAWSDWTTDASLASTLSADRIQKKTQYRYYRKETTTSYSTSLSGYTQDGGTWVKQSTKSFNYASFPSGFDTGNSIYTSFHKSCDVSASESTTNKRVIDSNSWAGYVYWHWMYDTDYANGSSKRAILNRSGKGVTNNYNYKYFGAFTSSKGDYSSSTGYSNNVGINYVVPERTSWNDCQGATRWFRFDYYKCTYSDYAKLFNYWKWSNTASEWQDAYIASTSDIKVETRTLYKYNLSALGHNFKDTSDKEYINTNTLNAPNPCYITGGKVCQRCSLRVNPDTTVNHSYPVFNANSSEWKLIADKGNTKVYRAHCRNGCGCYIEETTVECTWKKTVVAPTCEKDGYTRNVCSCGEHNYDSDFVVALGHYILKNDEGEIVQPATCTEAGILRHYCVRYDNGKTCNHYKDETILPKGHQMTKYDAVTATCTTDGNSEYYQCDICNNFYADANGDVKIEQNSWIISAEGHIDPSKVEWVVTDENGCGKTGWKKKYCNKVHDGIICGAVIAEEVIPEIPAKYHVIRAENAKLVSGDEYNGVWQGTNCLQDGIIYWTCENCEGTEKAHSSQPNVVEEPEVIDRLPHTEERRVVKEAYCIYPGQYEDYCTRCDTILEEGMIDPPCDEHNLVEIKADKGCIYNKCINSPCTYIEGGEHNFQRDKARDVEPTCIDKGLEAYTCTKCGEFNDKDRNPHGHNYVFKEKIEAKCTESGYDIYVCQRINYGKVCGDEIEKNYVNPIGHDLIKTEAVSPVCTVDGNFEYYTCQRDYCQKMFFDKEGYIETNATEIIDPKLGHDMGEWYANNDSTHTRDCQRDNGCTYSETKDCTFGDWQVTKEPTCTEKGEKERICTVCGYVEKGDIDPTDHDWDDGVINPVSTCKDHGTKTYTCKNDSRHTYTEAVDLDPQNHTGGTEIRDDYLSDCTNKGYTGNTYCLGCGVKLSDGEPVDELGHDMGEWYANNDSTHTRDCQRDNGCTYNETKDCTFGDWQVTKEPTCTEKGEKERICTVCGYVEKGDIDPTDHDWDDGVINPVSTCKDHGTKTYTCKNDSRHTYTEAVDLDPENHTGGTEIRDDYLSDCTNKGYTGNTYCLGCGVKLSDGEPVDELGHDMGEWYANNDSTHTRDCQRDNGCTYNETKDCTFGDWQVTKEPTCTEKGEKERICTVCGYVEKGEIGLKEHTPGEVVIENKNEPKCEEKGSYEDVVYCTECSKELSREEKEIPETGHDWDDGVINPVSTCKDHGTKTYTCKNDSRHTYTEAVDLDPENHTGGTEIRDDYLPDCINKGYTGNTYCLGCGVKLSDGEPIDELGHDMGEWTVSIKPTATTEGEERRDCTRCDYFETRPIPVLEKLTATFVADGKVVARINFYAGDEKLSYEPAVPSKDRYDGKWENYLPLGDKDITINAIYTLIPPDGLSEIETEKEAIPNEETRDVTIKLSASSDAETIITETTEKTPLDIVLVVDQSGSMAGAKLQELKDSVTTISDLIFEEAKLNDVDHRLAIVGFAMGSYTENEDKYPAFMNSEVLSVKGGPVEYSSEASEKLNNAYKNALVSVNDNGVKNTIITNAISAIDAEGATAANIGLTMAANIFSQNGIEGTNRSRVVIFMTDGEPTSYSSYDERNVANPAIQQANQLKSESCGATIYSVGIDCNTNINKKFLNAVSSNYDAVESMKSDISTKTNDFFFYSDNVDDLKEMFSEIVIREMINTTDFKDITLVDTVSKYFTLTTQQEDALRESVIAEYGITNADIVVTRNADGTTTIKIMHLDPKPVTGADGKVVYKASVEFTVSANANALVAGTYETNTEDAGVILSGAELYEKLFDKQTATFTDDKGAAIFKINGEVYQITSVEIGGVVLPPDYRIEAGYSFSDWDVPEDYTLNGGSVEFNAELEKTKYTVTWNVGNEVITQTYYPGDYIYAPEVDKTFDGLTFMGWNTKIPVTMPEKNLVFTACYAVHAHAYTTETTKYVTCVEDGLITYTCYCGDSYTEVVPAIGGEHEWLAITGEAALDNLSLEEFRCNKCNAFMSRSLVYEIVVPKTKYTEGKSKVVYDFSMYDVKAQLIQPGTEVTITMPVPEGLEYATSIEVYRIDGNEKIKLDSVYSRKHQTITFTTDHFCEFMFIGAYECEDGFGHTDEDGDSICDNCLKSFRCFMCDFYEKHADDTFLGKLIAFIHNFIHMANTISLKT